MEQALDMSGKTAVVVGGGGWLGLPIVETLLESDATVWIVGRSRSRLEIASEKCQRFGSSVKTLAADVTDMAEVSRVALTITESSGSISALVNCFHSATSDPAAEEGNERLPTRLTDVESHLRLTESFVDGLKAAVQVFGDACVVNIASMYGKVSPQPPVYQDTSITPSTAMYGASRAGVLQLTRWLAVFLAPSGIRVNSVSPGPFPQPYVLESSPEFGQKLESRVPLGRLGKRHEVAPVVKFLTSSGASYVTGADIPVDGGWTAW